MESITKRWSKSISDVKLAIPVFRLLISLIIAGLAIPTVPAQAQTPERLKFLGYYQAQELIDEFQDVGIAGDNGRFLVTASVTGLSVVERDAVTSGIVRRPINQYLIDRNNERSNLDGAPFHKRWAPKFYEVVSQGSYLYVATRWDGLWIFRLADNGAVNEVGRLLRPREFTESVKILNNRMFLTHHADGIEVLDLSDPADPQTLSILSDGFVDAWGIAPEADGSVWVADGAGGVKLARWNGTSLTHVTGETLATSPGVVQDVAVVGNWVVGAVAGQGVAVYDKATATRLRTLPLDGVCVDVEPIDSRRVAVSCHDWVHVIELDASGQPSIVASTRLHRRKPFDSFLPTYQAYRLAWQGDVLYVGGWHYAQAYQLVANDPDDDPDIRVSGQRAHFGAGPGAMSFQITNAGEGVLTISGVTCPAAIDCELGSTRLQPGASTDLILGYDGTTRGLFTPVDILSNDPDDGILPVYVVTPGGWVDPQEDAPDFTGNFVTYDYRTQTFTQSRPSLSDFLAAGDAVHLGYYGGFCPACAWKGTSIATDITAKLPQGAMNMLIDVSEAQAPAQHMMEKLYLPVGFMFSDAANDLYRQKDNWGSTGLPGFRDYVINPSGTVTTVLANEYSPGKILDAVEDAVDGGTPPEGADLAVSKSDSPDPVEVGQTLTYSLQVRNNGPDSATNVVLGDTLPSAVTFTSVTASQGGCSQTGGVVACNLGTLADGGLATVTLRVTPTAEGSITNSVSVASTESDPNLGNNSASATTTVGTAPPEPLNITDVSPDTVAIGSVAQLTVTGTGFQAGASAVVCKTGGVTINNLQVVSSNTVLIGITVAPDVSPKDCGVRITNPDGEADTLRPAFAIVPATGGADLAVSKSDSPDPVEVGQTLTYSLQVRNNGPDGATNVVLTDTLPSAVTFGSVTSSQGSCSQASGVVTCNLGTLANGGLATVTVLVTPSAEGSITNSVSVTSAESDPNVGNNSASVTTTVGTAPPEPLNIIDVSPDTVAIGAVAQLTVTGTGFQAGASAVVCKTGGVTINNLQVVSSTTVLIDITVASNISPKDCGVRIINPDGEVDTLNPAFAIE
jgi:uncharacterized repeat protein (TIGR01451 family)